MRKHPFDLYALFAGGLFTTLAVLYLVASVNDYTVDKAVVLPATVLVLVGGALCGGVLALVRRGRRGPNGGGPGGGQG